MPPPGNPRPVPRSVRSPAAAGPRGPGPSAAPGSALSPGPVRARGGGARLLFADSERDADMLYATRFHVPDPFLLLVRRGVTTILLSDLEVDRGRREAAVDEVVSLTEFSAAHKKVLGRSPSPDRVIAHFLRSRRVRRVVVPANFPLGLAQSLQRAGLQLRPAARGSFWPQRARKDPAELVHLRRAQRLSAAGLARAVEVLTAATVGRDRRLRWGGATLTSERLRAEIDGAVLRAGGLPTATIVAGGDQACDPHERGHGPLRAGELIILDVFPRDARSGYHGDMTRTVVKGRATDAQRQLYDAVHAGQSRALAGLRAGASGVRLHRELIRSFARAGYPTEQRDGRWVGFFHGTGHGLGLDIHEAPRFSKTRRFAAGEVLTVEPGLYYPGLGGVRLEDVAVVTAEGPAELLSRFDKRLEIPAV